MKTNISGNNYHVNKFDIVFMNNISIQLVGHEQRWPNKRKEDEKEKGRKQRFGKDRAKKERKKEVETEDK